ncbi:MAG TPA: carbohydrate kinase family protein [Anaerolineales bacterium]|nr:carbohydrate kinase family protein [Anaerolineales bacterium]
MAATSLRFVIAGQLKRDFALLASGKALVDVPGGNLIYAASGFGVWEQADKAGLLARVGEDYPHEWLDEMRRRGFDTQGIRILPEAVDLRNFYTYTDVYTKLVEDPAAHFTRLQHPFPKALLNYARPANNYDSRSRLTSTSLRQSDIPEDYLDATAAHLCPIDYLTHTLLPAVLRQNGFSTVTLDPSEGSMSPTFWDDIPALVTGLTAFLPNEQKMRMLFHGRSTDLWEMMEIIADYGCEIVIVKRGEGGQYLYDRATRAKWEIPAYPARVVDITGTGDAYCGGFLAGYRQTYEPIQAALFGSVSASLTVEGSGAFYALDGLPGLAQARLNALKEGVRKA